MKPTNPDEEKNKGRIALWLAPEYVEFLVNEWRKIPDNAPEHIKETWARIAFRASTSLHKAGVTLEPQFPQENEKYIID